ncbi:hypothetical protein PIB30_020840 [Stylosanthes scabra]|uniref:Uncharacterized protein n=1 Tax=Stylosanthes scabra TaxID=79078 RepID=A0ABU6UBX8_9FABA|nr:hypothetical protein [Stylosanthes scabra]
MTRGDRGRGRRDQGKGTRGRRGRPRKSIDILIDLGEAKAGTSTPLETSTLMILTPFLSDGLPAMRKIPTPGSKWISGPKCRGRTQGKLKRTREARRTDKKPKKSPTMRQPRARAPKMARPRPPFLNMEVLVGGAPARPILCARATPFRNAQDKDLARPRDRGGAPTR